MSISKNILNELDLRRSREYTVYVKNIINKEFEKIKAKLILNFEKHPITQEIDAGPNALNSSGTLGGVGNLFSYIGFEKGSKPTQVIKNLLMSGTGLTSIIFKKDGSALTRVFYPTPDEIFKATPLPWAQGRSWAEGIERGLSGFGYYLSIESNISRSGHGIQSKNNVRPGKFQNTKYITSIIREFEKDIQILNRSSF